MRIYLSPLIEDEFEEYYKLKCQDDNLFWTNYIKKPNKINIFDWCKNQLTRKEREIFLVKRIGIDDVVGYAYIDYVDEADNTYEISYAISNIVMGQGYGTELVRLLTDYCYHKYGTINELHAWVLENNIKSQKCLLRNGWIETIEQKEIFFLPSKDIKLMKKFILGGD